MMSLPQHSRSNSIATVESAQPAVDANLVNFFSRSILPVGNEIKIQLDSGTPMFAQVSESIVNDLAFGIPSFVLLGVADGYRSPEPNLPAIAAAIEVIQTSMLFLHGNIDVQQDEDDNAGNRSEVAKSSTVLVSDFLTTRAFQSLANVGRLDVMRKLSDAITETVASVTTLGLENENENENESESEFDPERPGIPQYPFAILAGTAASIGAALAGASVDEQRKWMDYGQHIGIAAWLLGLRVPFHCPSVAHSFLVERSYLRHRALSPRDLDLAWHHCFSALDIAATNRSISDNRHLVQLCRHCADILQRTLLLTPSSRH
jgi:hypothetical protein